MSTRGWFSDVDREQKGEFVWQPCFETGEGHVPCFEIWFASKAECDEWIEMNVLGADWLDGEEPS